MPALTAIPLVSSRARLQPGGAGSFVVDTDDYTLEFEGSSARLLHRIAHRFDGGHAVADLAAAAHCDANELASVVATLCDHGVVLDLAAAVDARSPREFSASFRHECRFWSGEILAQRFWSRLMSGQASKAVVFGWGIEAYHYVESVNEYMAAAVANCALDHETRMLMGRHFAEESEHGEIFLHGLVDSGFAREAIVAAPPLPATRGLMNFLFELACVDTFAIEATFNLMQADREIINHDRVNAFYGALTKFYPFAAPMLDAFRKHALIDVDSSHGRTVFDAMCEVPNLVTPEIAARCVAAVRSAAEHFILFFENIDSYYGGGDAVMPRRAVDVMALL